jgi:NAD(P)-dependent dehydrogenase (short-subunit alcohol dehydrogenase family)
MREGAGRFAGRTIIITGAGGNFGRAGTLYFAREGANVVAMDYNAEELAGTLRMAEQICGAGGARGQCYAIVVDVTSEDEVARAVAEAAAKFGRIELLWNNAGTMGDIAPTLQYSAREFRRVLEVNVVGMFIVLRAVAAVMAASGGGAICNTASVAGMRGTPAMPACEWLPPGAAPAPARLRLPATPPPQALTPCAPAPANRPCLQRAHADATSKSAALGLTVSAAKDLAPHGIRVNAVSPALIGESSMWLRQNELHAKSGSPYYATDPEAVAAAKIASVPLKRLGSVDEVVQSVAFLLSDDSSYTTATNLVVDGGMAGGLKA